MFLDLRIWPQTDNHEPDFMSQPKSVWFDTVIMISTTSNKIQKKICQMQNVHGPWK